MKLSSVALTWMEADRRSVLHDLHLQGHIQSGGKHPILQKKVADILESERAFPTAMNIKALSMRLIHCPWNIYAMTAEIARLLQSLIRAEREHSVQCHLDTMWSEAPSFRGNPTSIIQ